MTKLTSSDTVLIASEAAAADFSATIFGEEAQAIGIGGAAATVTIAIAKVAGRAEPSAWNTWRISVGRAYAL